METACKKNWHTQNKNLITIYISLHSYPFTIQKLFYFSFLCLAWYIENTCFLEECNPIEDLFTIENTSDLWFEKNCFLIYTTVTARFRKTFEFSNKISYSGIFGWNLKKTVAIFEISTLEIFNMQSFMQKQKILRFRAKMLYLGIFGLDTKYYIHIWTQHPRICLLQNLLIWVFSTEIWKKYVILQFSTPEFI